MSNRLTQETFCASDAPIDGPLAVPIAQAKLITPNHVPRVLIGTRSVAITSVRIVIAPLPTPWKERPTMRVTGSLENAHVTPPTVKKATARIMMSLRPKMGEKATNTNWTIVDVRLKDVDAQIA
jgi:hypothetical protein